MDIEPNYDIDSNNITVPTTPFEEINEVNEEVAKRVLRVVDAGLSDGIGEPIPGQMCVEAAVCYAMGLPHSDQPRCVAPVLRDLKITLNDAAVWLNAADRAKGLRRLAIAQLGSDLSLDEAAFVSKVEAHITKTFLAPFVEEMLSRVPVDDTEPKQFLSNMLAAAREGKRSHSSSEIERACFGMADAFDFSRCMSAPANYPSSLRAETAIQDFNRAVAVLTVNMEDESKLAHQCAEGIVQILIEMNAPGTQWLHLTTQPVPA